MPFAGFSGEHSLRATTSRAVPSARSRCTASSSRRSANVDPISRASGCRSTSTASSATSAVQRAATESRPEIVADIGFVGLGVMGGGIAKRLLDAGYRVVGHNRTREKAEWLLEQGMEWADTPREASEASDF